MADDFKVYWQPGCSSCLRAKEFLATRGIAYESINVRARPEAMEELAGLGAQSVPVVVQGKRFVFAQDLGDLARFIGVEFDRVPLPPAELVRRLDLILAAAQRYLVQFPAADLEEGLPGRERTILDLGYHIFVIPAAFLDAAHGARLTFDYFERTPGPDMRSAAQVAAYGQSVRDALQGLVARGRCRAPRDARHLLRHPPDGTRSGADGVARGSARPPAHGPARAARDFA